jgi:hypothetical protein
VKPGSSRYPKEFLKRRALMPEAKLDFATALVRARNYGPRLAETTDEVNEGLRDATEAIKSLGLGVSGFVEFPLDTDDPNSDWQRYLRFGKLDNEWCLCVLEGPGGMGEEAYRPEPLLNCSKKVRLAAVDLLPALVAELVSKAEKAIVESEKKAKALSMFVSAVRSGPEADGNPVTVSQEGFTDPSWTEQVVVRVPLPPEPNTPLKSLTGAKKRRGIP